MMETRVLEMLGLPKRTVNRLTTALMVADRIEEGLSAKAIDSLKEASRMTDTEMSSVLGTSEKTIGRARTAHQEKRLPPTIGDRLYRAAHIVALAEEVLESREAAQEWLHSSQIGLNNRTPLEMMRTEVGAREVENLLGRMEYGVYS